MRFAAYAGTSVALAAGTVIRAFHERSNFYSASVALAQSNASLMILTNVALLGVSMFMIGLQRLFYGPLRPIEVEQLYEKAWFAITETCLAMTIFREEVGGWFLVMFVGLLIGKVWGWIGEGRVEILEQQPPANPRMFHTQLSLSLSISTLFDFFMLRYAVNTVLRHARPNMMVMFAFEFAVLTVNSLSTAARYGIFVFEASVIRKQINERRSQMRRDRDQAQLEAISSQTPPSDTASGVGVSLEENIDTMEFDPPGWEEKGRWIFYLDLTTDFLKLILYLTFFCVLCMFYGMPIHIIRDVALTIRSFHKRIRDFMRYRQATRDMNKRYPDATVEEIAREDVCIICRENMQSWSGGQNGQHAEDQANPDGGRTNQVDERARPKKLPCGHILHFACLRSWLERQQNCPTCRRPVLVPNSATPLQAPHSQPQEARAQAPAPPNQLHQRAQVGQAGQPGQNPAPPPNVYQFGPIRIAFGARPLPRRPSQPNIAPSNQERSTSTMGGTSTSGGQPFTGQQIAHAQLGSTSTVAQLQEIEQQLVGQINGLRLQHDQLYLVRALQAELVRLRLSQANSGSVSQGPQSDANHDPAAIPMTQPRITPLVAPHRSRHPLTENQLPAGITIPVGWTLTPLRRLSPNTDSSPAEARSLADRSVGADSRSSSSVQLEIPDRTTINSNTHIPAPFDSVPAGEFEDVANVTNQQDQAAVAPSESTSCRVAVSPQLSSDPIEDISSHPNPTIPTWGSSPADLKTDATKNSTECSTDAFDLETQMDAGNSQEETRDKGKGKGKGKATTVEDSNDDID